MQDLLDPHDSVRLINALVATLGAVFLAVRLNDDWIRLTKGWRVARLATLGLVFVFGFGSIELMMTSPPVPLGLRAYFALVCLLTLLLGLLMITRENRGEAWMKVSEVQRILDKVEHHHLGPCHHPGCLEARDELRAGMQEARRLAQ